MVKNLLSIECMIRTTQTSGVFNFVCGLYRCADISQNKACCWYFDIVNAEAIEAGLVLGHLHIAEDHILAYAAISSRLLEEYGKSQERQRVEQGILAAESDNFGGAGSEIIVIMVKNMFVIAQEYQAQGAVVSRNIRSYGDDKFVYLH